MKISDHLILDHNTIKQALNIINDVGLQANVLFVIDENDVLRGSVSDGDIRRALLRDISIDDNITKAMNKSCEHLFEDRITNELMRQYRQKRILLLPVVDSEGKLKNILDLDEVECIVPVETVLMAGGKGERLLPLTLTEPKPLLKVGGKPIIEYTIDRLSRFGINKVHISINHMGQKIRQHFKEKSPNGIKIKYLRESKPLGTIGSLSLLKDVEHDSILLMNSDLLTNINIGSFYEEFVRNDADLIVASVPYHIDLPYAVLELEDDLISSLKEKPRYTYFANAGIYLMKKEVLKFIPYNKPYSSIDLIQQSIKERKKVANFPIVDYWLDIGQMEDYQKAQEDYKRINF